MSFSDSLPNVIVAALILVVAAFIAHAMQRDSGGFGQSGRVPSLSLYGRIDQVVHLGFRHLGRALYQLESQELSLKLCLPDSWRWSPSPEKITFRFGWTRHGFQIHRTS